MLNPKNNRLDYGSILSPPSNYEIDFSIGTTYSIDLDALVGASISIGLSQENDSDLKSIIYKFPEDIQENYKKASVFSEFNYVLRIIYNLIVSDNKNEKAIKEFGSIDFEEVSNIDIDDIMNSLGVYNHYLRNFLNKSKELMQKEDIDDLKDLIKSREVWLKGANRAKTSHPGEFDENLWFAGERLDYRFTNAKNIIRDIYESEKNESGD